MTTTSGPLSSPANRPVRSPIDIELKTQSSTHDSPSEPEEEARPSHTAEIGTLKKLSVPGGTAWLGSSSGVYFVNTVRRAFSAAFASNAGAGGNLDDSSSDPDAVPASEDIITGEDAAGRSFNGATNVPSRNAWWLHDADFHRRIVAAVGRPPSDRRLAMDLVTTFFRTTHPLFPFLHGPKFLEDVNEIYTALAQQPIQSSTTGVGPNNGGNNGTNKPTLTSSTSAPHARRTNSTTSINSNHSTYLNNLGNIQTVDPLKLITFQIIINIAALTYTNNNNTSPSNGTNALPQSSTIPSPQSLLTLILPLSTTPLLPTIQLLLSAELYLLSTISLRSSSTLAGLVLRLIYHAGLHRCPLRYASLTPQDCEIRKRIFWSAYALDRHLSLALGDPNTFQDSDIDVCLSRDGDGEMHRAVARDLLTEEEREQEMRLHYPRDSGGRRVVFGEMDPRVRPLRVGEIRGEQGHGHLQSSTSGQDDHHFQQQSAGSGSSNRRKNSTSAPPSLPNTPNTGHTTSNTTGTGPSPHTHPSTNPNTHTHPIPTSSSNPNPLSARSKQLREAALTAYVHYGKLTGRIIEIFHKSINFRFPKEDAIGFLSADIENWWNDLPGTLTGDSTFPVGARRNGGDAMDVEKGGDGDGNGEDGEDEEIDPGLIQQHKMLTPFFTLLYHQLLLLLNRPRLSLDQATAQFQEGLQVCIRASRNTLSALKKHRENGQSMFLPGLLSAAWMSGLIIAFACQLGKYPKTRACSDIKSCLVILEAMNVKWYTVKNCHKVLSLLLANITARKAASNGNLPAGRNDSVSQAYHSTGVSQSGSGVGSGNNMSTLKRTRDSTSMDTPSEAEPSPKRDSLAGLSPASSDFRPPPRFRSPEMRSNSTAMHAAQPSTHDPTPNVTASFLRQESTMSSSAFDFASAQPPASAFRSMNFNSNPGPINPVMDPSNQQRSGAALYADPQDMAFAQSNHSMGLNEMSSMDDQMFWGNMDSNLFDVFGAVSWETMTGPVGPMASNPNVWDMSGFPNSGGGVNDPNVQGGNRFM